MVAIDLTRTDHEKAAKTEKKHACWVATMSVFLLTLL